MPEFEGRAAHPTPHEKRGVRPIFCLHWSEDRKINIRTRYPVSLIAGTASVIPTLTSAREIQFLCSECIRKIGEHHDDFVTLSIPHWFKTIHCFSIRTLIFLPHVATVTGRHGIFVRIRNVAFNAV
jgi:hypothetical protein